jgi:hypothetical protein
MYKFHFDRRPHVRKWAKIRIKRGLASIVAVPALTAVTLAFTGMPANAQPVTRTARNAHTAVELAAAATVRWPA